MNFDERLRKISSEIQALKTIRPRSSTTLGVYAKTVNVDLMIRGRNDTTDGDAAYRHYSQSAVSALVYFPDTKWGDSETMLSFALGATQGRIFTTLISGKEDYQNFSNTNIGVYITCERGNVQDEAELGGDSGRTKTISVELVFYSTKKLGDEIVEYSNG